MKANRILKNAKIIKYQMESDLRRIERIDEMVRSYRKSIESYQNILQKTLQSRNETATQYNSNSVKLNKVMELLDKLPHVQKDILFSIYFNNKTISQLSKSMCCSPEEVLNIHDVALEKIEHIIQEG